ncbi:outer membrane lipoprotein carrier protein LolA [Streptomyces roseoverticillatus]|uniref:LolA family protein n=1 Tax=Streptomyces roseoverticillatus TaxID=66429 RepID=UPI001F1FB856|nr:sigma-E factor regulatory protein RseB domain-containing protein [Streptomyces roseoverticillatus]MCF3103327.1 outer membrane lipoprotein carrier protein LolA [Streptomyces roseoverticillatus]
MARIEPTHGTDGAADAGEGARRAHGRRKAVRYAVPVAVAGVAAASIGIGTALASSGDPDLPKISAQDLIAKMAKSDTQQLSGTVKVTTDLGLPSLPSGLSLGDAPGGGKAGHGSGGKDAGADTSPQAKLTELASGTHTLRVAADGPDKQRLSIVERAAEYSMIRNGGQVWAYDSKSNTVHHSTAPKGAHGGKEAPQELRGASPQELAKKTLDAVDDSTSVTVDGTAKVAGRDAYQLVLKPKAAETTVGAVRIAVDAKNGVPLKFTLSPKGGGKAVVDAAFTKVDFGKPGADTFDFKPPKGAKVTEDKADGKEHKAGPGKDAGAPDLSGMNVLGKSWTSIAELKAPGGVGSGAGAKGAKDAGPAGALLDSLGSKVSGSFGSGHVFSTRLVNALVTDDGKVYAGAVTKDALIKAASK